MSVVLILSGCSNTPWDPIVNPSLPPNVFYFQIKNNNNTLRDSILSSITIFHYENGKKIDGYCNDPDPNVCDTSYVYLPNRYTDNLDNFGILASPYISYIILNKGQNTMYLEYPDGNIDTLYVEIGSLEYNDAIKNRCYCTTPFTKVMFNEKDAPESTELHAGDGKPVFLFKK